MLTDRCHTVPAMWTPNSIRRHRLNSDDDDDSSCSSQKFSDAPRTHKKSDKLLVETLDRIAEALERNAEVLSRMNDAVTAMNNLQTNTHALFPDTKREDKVSIELKCTFLKIGEIDTVNQRFEAELFVQAKWEEPLLQQPSPTDGISPKDKDDVDKLIPWNPKLTVMNIESELVLNRTTYNISYNQPGCKHPVVVQLWRFKGFFKENLELEHFPVDVQELTISVSSERSDKELELIEDRTSLSSINKKAFIDQEWTLYTHIESHPDFTTIEYCSSTEHPILHFQCRVARKTGYFVWNIIFIMLLIVSLTFAGFCIDFANSDRLSVTVTLFLTAVAFKLVVKQSLPTISYLTYLDIYVIAALIFLALQAAQNAAMGSMSHFLDRVTVKFYDKWSMVMLGILLLIFHIFFAFFILRTASKKRRIMDEKDKTYQAKKYFLEQYGSLPPRYDTPIRYSTDFDSIIPGRRMKKHSFKHCNNAKRTMKNKANV